MTDYSDTTIAVLNGLTPVIDTDHPLSQGRSLYVLSSHPHASASIQVTPGVEAEFCSNSGGLLRFDRSSFKVIMALGGDTGRVRLFELIAHEASHYVDRLFESCGVVPCTEMRAHYLDWVVGKVAQEFRNLRDDEPSCPSRSQTDLWR